jgi:hypothetical protein
LKREAKRNFGWPDLIGVESAFKMFHVKQLSQFVIPNSFRDLGLFLGLYSLSLGSFRMITILPETKAFFSAIHEINVLAFGRNKEAKLVENLRNPPDFVHEISFVAIKGGRVVGHILV